jgi:phosphoribosylaminoimidazole (AIR) synthetase
MTANPPTNAYREAGVDIDAGNRCRADEGCGAPPSPQCAGRRGQLCGLFTSLTDLPAQPVLVGSIDSVGTKVKLAAGRAAGGIDGTWSATASTTSRAERRPLFFLDYIASSKLDPQAVAEVVTGKRKPAAPPAAPSSAETADAASMPKVPLTWPAPSSAWSIVLLLRQER